MVARIVGERPERQFSLAEDSESDTVSRKYLVRTTKRTDDIDVVARAPGLPRRGYLHPRAPDLWVTSVTGTQDPRAWFRWEVDIGYSKIKPSERDEQGRPDAGKLADPIKREPDISGRFAEYQFVATASAIYDIQDNLVGFGGEGAVAFTSSAGELFDPTPEQTGYFILTTIKRNESMRPIRLWRDYVGSVNTNVVSGFAKGQVALIGISWSSWKYEQGVRFCEVTYELGVKENRDPWQLKLLDHGTYYLNGSAKVPFKDSEGNPRLGLLNGSGAELGNGDPPKYRTFVVRKKMDFGRLRLPRFDR